MILGAVLAGGQSRRFGSDKAIAVWKGRSLLDHAIANLSPFVDDVIVCGRRTAAVPSIPDRPLAGLGPLGGLNAALHHAAMLAYDRVITVPCDAPAIPSAAIADLIAADGDCFSVAMPVIGCWRTARAGALDSYLQAAETLSVRRWAVAIGAAGMDLGHFPNINRPEDLDRLGAA